jgi:hypothetical protein
MTIVLGLAACDDSGSSTETTSGSPAVTTSTTTPAPITTAAPTTVSGGTTSTITPSSTVPPDTAPPDTALPDTAPATACAGQSVGIPTGATDPVAINGDIDGDTIADVVTSYALDGVPHVHATLATGLNSDVEVPLGNADTVEIEFMDFDHAGGASVPPPLAVIAIGASKAGTAVATFLSLTPEHCIRVWHSNNDESLFSFRISAEPIYEGLQCDGAAGSIIHSLTTAQQNPGGDWNVTVQPFGHDFTTVQLHDIENLTVPDGPDIQHQYGDLTSCGITLFP